MKIFMRINVLAAVEYIGPSRDRIAHRSAPVVRYGVSFVGQLL